MVKTKSLLLPTPSLTAAPTVVRLRRDDLVVRPTKRGDAKLGGLPRSFYLTKLPRDSHFRHYYSPAAGH